MKLAISQNIAPVFDGQQTEWCVERANHGTLSIRLRGDVSGTIQIIERIVHCVNVCADLDHPVVDLHRLQCDSKILQQKREQDAEWGYSAYSVEIENLAADIHQRFPDSDDDHNDRCDAVHEAVDANAWVVQAPDKILEHSGNEPDNSEAAAMAGPDADWEKVRQVAAFMVMEADVYEALSGLDEHSKDRLSDLEDDVLAHNVMFAELPAPAARNRWRVLTPYMEPFIVNDDGDVFPNDGTESKDDSVELDDLTLKAKLAICRKIDEPRPESKAAAE